jgi:hypothetical protein
LPPSFALPVPRGAANVNIVNVCRQRKGLGWVPEGEGFGGRGVPRSKSSSINASTGFIPPG